MSCDFVKNHIDEYFENTLSESEFKEFDEHVFSCKECTSIIRNYRKYFDLLRRLDPGFDPPGYIIDNLSDALMKIGTEEISESKTDNKKLQNTLKGAVRATKRKKERIKKAEKSLNYSKIFRIVLIVLGLMSTAYLVYAGINVSNEPWTAELINGAYTINGSVSNNNELFIEDNILTKTSSSIKINIPLTGEIIMDEKTLLVIKSGQDQNNTVYLKEGSLDVTTYSSLPSLKIITDVSTVVDRKAQFKFSIFSDNSQTIEVIKGLVTVDFANVNTPVGAGYKFQIKGGYESGVPYRSNASPQLITELDNYLHNSGGMESLQNLLSAATEADVITLWNLIRKVDKNELLMVYEKLNKIYPVPEGVTKRKVLSLNKEVLDLWWEEIEWQL